MLRYLFLLIFLFAVPSSYHVRAQEPTPFASVYVQLWPEFDRASMLVMYQISLSPQVKLPTEITVRIPAAVGKPNAVAYCELDSPCMDNPYTQRPPSGDWSELVIPVSLPADVRVEYYDSRLVKNGSSRSFEYVWPGDHSVDSFSVQVQQPFSARDMRIKPGTVQVSRGEDGMNYYSLMVGTVPAGQEVEVAVNYTKDTDELSNSSLPIAPAESLDDDARSLPLPSNTLAAMLGLLGALLVVGGGVWYWLSGRQAAVAPRRTRVRRRSASREISEGRETVTYCHQCGNRAAAGDRFCRVCGVALRKS